MSDYTYQKSSPRDYLILPSQIEEEFITFEINDPKITYIYDLHFNLTLPEIKGNGAVAYIKDHEAALIKNIKITYVNPNNNHHSLVINSLDFLEKIRSSKFPVDLANQSTTYRTYCDERYGENIDDIIFEKYSLRIPIKLPTQSISIYPETKVIIEIQIDRFVNILTYDRKFKETSLDNLEKYQKVVSKDYNLTFSNGSHWNNNTKFCVKTFKESHQKGDFFASQHFSNVVQFCVYSRMKHFNSGYTFLFNPGYDMSEKAIVKKFIDNFKKDLLVFVGKGESPPSTNYIKVEKGIVRFTKNAKCKVDVKNLPDDVDVYFHSNILSYERRCDEGNLLNISHLFRKLEVIYINRTTFMFVDIDHSIKAIHASIPLEFWTHETNTSTGDMRSNKSKRKDFIYSNPFIFGLDFTSRNEFLECVDTTIANINYKFRKIIDPLSSMSSHLENTKMAYFNLHFLIRDCVYSNNFDGMNQFFLRTTWKTFPDSSIIQLFVPSLISEITELRWLYHNDGEIAISDKNALEQMN